MKSKFLVGGKDGVIDHNADQIYLWLNPQIDLCSNATGNDVRWTFDTVAAAPIVIYPVAVGWLNGKMPMPGNVAAQLAAAGITPADYPEILAQDPFANGATAIDPNRFQQTTYTLPYTPSYDPNPQTNSFTSVNIKNELISTQSTAVQMSYNVGYSISASFDVDPLTIGVTSKATWTWTNNSSVDHSADNTQSATATIYFPGAGYTDPNSPTSVAVYWDSVYNSFLMVFVPPDAVPSVKGKVVDASGRRAKGQLVTLQTPSGVRRTYTDSRGEYRISPAGRAARRR